MYHGAWVNKRKFIDWKDCNKFRFETLVDSQINTYIFLIIFITFNIYLLNEVGVAFATQFFEHRTQF